MNIEAWQPEAWLARGVPDAEAFADPALRLGIRYQYAFEKSSSRFLFLMHNDVFIIKDIIGDMEAQIGDAFAIGQIGQCWNCPASRADLTQRVMGRKPCKPDNFESFRPDYGQLRKLYAEARDKGIFARPYDEGGFSEEFREKPWPLPECRVNEWACLLNLEKMRPACKPLGSAWPPGAFKDCGAHNLDILVATFRDLHHAGMHARHFDISKYLRHWVGSGNKSAIRYTYSEDRALRLLQKYFPDYRHWLAEKKGVK